MELYLRPLSVEKSTGEDQCSEALELVRGALWKAVPDADIVAQQREDGTVIIETSYEPNPFEVAGIIRRLEKSAFEILNPVEITFNPG